MKSIRVPVKELKFTFSKSSGAGGQNVNKVNSRVTLKWNVLNSLEITSAVKNRLTQKYPRFVVDGFIVIHSQRFRDQSRNIADCTEKLQSLLESVAKAPKKRIPTKPSKAAIKKRIENKKKQSEKKQQRQQKF